MLRRDSSPLFSLAPTTGALFSAIILLIAAVALAAGVRIAVRSQADSAAHDRASSVVNMSPAKGNVADTDVVEQARKVMAETRETDICKVLREMYNSTPPGEYRNKIRATMKYFNCTRSRERR